jgi:hypothetical protein
VEAIKQKSPTGAGYRSGLSVGSESDVEQAVAKQQGDEMSKQENPSTVDEVLEQLDDKDIGNLIIAEEEGFRTRLTVLERTYGLKVSGHPEIRTREGLIQLIQDKPFRIWTDPRSRNSLSTNWMLQDWIDRFWWGEVMGVYAEGLNPVYDDYFDWSMDLWIELPWEPGKNRQVWEQIWAMPEFTRVNLEMTKRANVKVEEWGLETFFPRSWEEMEKLESMG